MDSENFNKLNHLSKQIRDKTVDIQQKISQPDNYLDPSYQRLMKEALAIQKEWKQLISIYFTCAALTLVVGFCIMRLIGELGIFVAVPLLMPVAINFCWHGLRLLLQGDPLDEFPNFCQKRRN